MKKLGSIAIISSFLVMIIGTVMAMGGHIYGDEYMFVRITQNLPSVSTSSEWLTVEHPEMTSDLLTTQDYKNHYDTEFWIHPLLPNYLVYPLFKVINPMIPRVARTIPLILILGIVVFLFDIIKRQFNMFVASLSLLPFLLSMQLLGGGIWLYYDFFMWFFLALSLWIIYVKPQSKWLYATIPAILLSKEIGAFYLIPLMIGYYYQTKNLKRSLTLLAPLVVLIGWWAWMWAVTGDSLYYYHHLVLIHQGSHNYLLENLTFYLIGWGLLFYFILTLLGFATSIKDKKYWCWSSLYFLACLYAIGWNLEPFHVFCMLFASMFMTVLSVDWLKRRFMIGEEEWKYASIQ